MIRPAESRVVRTWAEVTMIARRVMGPVSVRTVQRLHARYDLRIGQATRRGWVCVEPAVLEARLIELLRMPRAGQRVRLQPHVVVASCHTAHA